MKKYHFGLGQSAWAEMSEKYSIRKSLTLTDESESELTISLGKWTFRQNGLDPKCIKGQRDY